MADGKYDLGCLELEAFNDGLQALVKETEELVAHAQAVRAAPPAAGASTADAQRDRGRVEATPGEGLETPLPLDPSAAATVAEAAAAALRLQMLSGSRAPHRGASSCMQGVAAPLPAGLSLALLHKETDDMRAALLAREKLGELGLTQGEIEDALREHGSSPPSTSDG